VDVFDEFLHYEADTQPGSSGSPVFNDQWELVALHHASVPAPEHPELGKFVNEGIRISRLLAFIGAQDYTDQQRALVSGLLGTGQSPAPEAAPDALPDMRTSPAPSRQGSEGVIAASPASVTVPLQITITAGEQAPGVTSAPARSDEAITIDPDYPDRQGYDPQFLGGGALEVPLPALSEELAPLAAINSLATGDPRYV